MKSNKALGCGCLSVVMGLIVIVVILGSAYLLNFALKPSYNKGVTILSSMPSCCGAIHG